MTIWTEFAGPNAAYVEELYERYQRDPNSVDASTRAYFDLSPLPPLLRPQVAPRQVRGPGGRGRFRAMKRSWAL